MSAEKLKLDEVCYKGSSTLMQKSLPIGSGEYPVYGASGLIGEVDFYMQENAYIGIVKDGAGVGRAMLLPAKSSCLGTIQYILPKETIDIRYLFYAIENMRLSKYSTGATIPHIYFKDYKNELIPNISLDEQQAVASKLDSIQRSIKRRQAQLALFDDLVKSQFIEMFGDMASNDKCWDIVPLSEIAEYFNGLTYKPENVSDDGLIVFRSSNIQDSELDFADIVRVDSKVKEKLFVKDGDILMCSRNGSAKLVGKVAEINRLKEPATFGAFMMVIRSAYPKYLLTYFKLPVFREQIKVGATTTINQITSSMLDKIRLPLPPQVLINEYSQFVEQTDKSKFRIKQSLEKLEKCYKALLQKYFG